MINIKNCIKKRTILEVPVVNMKIEVFNNHSCKKEGWNYINNFGLDSKIEDILYESQMKNNDGIEGYTYKEYNHDTLLQFRFINTHNKKLEDFKEMVNEIGKYIYDIRIDKGKICTVSEIQLWLDKNLNNIINKYR